MAKNEIRMGVKGKEGKKMAHNKMENVIWKKCMVCVDAAAAAAVWKNIP